MANGHVNLLGAKICLFSLPGIGNIQEKQQLMHLSLTLLKLLEYTLTALPPLATLDEDGLLSPPHLSIRVIPLDESEHITQ